MFPRLGYDSGASEGDGGEGRGEIRGNRKEGHVKAETSERRGRKVGGDDGGINPLHELAKPP